MCSIFQVAGVSASPGSTPSLLRNPWGIFVDSNYTLYIVDAGNNRVQKFLQGELLSVFIDLLTVRLDNI